WVYIVLALYHIFLLFRVHAVA
ncbi:MAG: hypothetical protein H6Q07_2481, partial [Acidobacteria bacterium]|nr:hypothetical protein [Acidobacteriota bacterium]